MKRIKLCADDYGMNKPVNEAILSLVKTGRLNAVSCMSTMTMLAPYADELLEAVFTTPHRVDIGLHLTFTEYEPLTELPSLVENDKFPEIGKLIIKSHLRQIKIEEIKREITAQFKKFEEIFGCKPDFVDGHQHAHILPIIRDALFEVAKEHLPQNGWMRLCHQPISSILKTGISLPRSLIISTLSRPMKNLLQKHNIKSNDLFLGINDFNPQDYYRAQMQAWLKLAYDFNGETLIMCHPGMKPESNSMIHDPIASRRPDELNYLTSDEFMEDLADNNITLNEG